MKPSELIKSLSPNGYIDTGLMYSSGEPYAVDICNLYKAGVPIDILDTLKEYKMYDLFSVENNMSLLKKIEHPSQITGGFAISPKLADTITSFYGRDKLLETGRAVNQHGYYSEEELTSSVFLKHALERSSDYLPFTLISSLVRTNKNCERSLEAAKKAYTLYKGNVDLSYLNREHPCGTVFFMRDNLISLDAFSIIVSIYGRVVKEKIQLNIDTLPDINDAYKKYRTEKAPIPSNYIKESGRSINSLFNVYSENDLEPTDWEIVDTTSGYPMYIAKNGDKTVATIVGKTNEEILEDINKKIERNNELYGVNLNPVLLSTIGDFFLPTVFTVHC